MNTRSLLIGTVALWGILGGSYDQGHEYQHSVNTAYAQAVVPDVSPLVPKITAENVFDKVEIPQHLEDTDWVLIDTTKCEAEQINLIYGPSGECAKAAKVRLAKIAPGVWQFGFGKNAKGHVVLALYGTFDGKPVCRMHEVVVGAEPAPGPGPGPTPGPGPSPLPPGKYGLAQWSYDEAMKLPAATRAKSAQMADAFESVAAAIAAGTITDGQDAINQCGAKTAGLPEWATWLTAWAGKAETIGLVTVQDIAIAFTETATGLKAVK